jgi:hypothetical protein
LLEHGHRALAATVADGVRDQCPLGASPQAGAAQAVDTDEVAEVRHDPVLAGLDEPVFAEAVDVRRHQGQLTIDDGEEVVERGVQLVEAVRLLVAVADAVDGRQEVEHAGHAGRSEMVAPEGSSSASSAGAT